MNSVGIIESAGPHNSLVWLLNRPAQRNAVGPAELEWIAERCAQLQGNLVTLRGADEQVFCSGFDLAALHSACSVLPDLPPTAALPDAPLAAAIAAMHNSDATFVAAINGHALGAGVELACACDLRLARADVSFSIPAARLGVIYRPEGVALLGHVFGPGLATEMLLADRTITASQAAHAGAFTVVDAASFDARLEATIARLAQTRPATLAAHRDMLRRLRPRMPEERPDRFEAARRAAFSALTVSARGPVGAAP